MENLWIEIVDGQPTNHPYFESNLFAAFPEWNGVIPLDRFASFVRVEPPVDKIVTGVEYQLVNGVWTDVFEYIDMPEITDMPADESDSDEI
jgi:hypothetical protein